jgi:hypothetical protein
MPQSGVAVAIGRNSFDPPAPVVPVFDIHARSMVMHDSGTSGSGILYYNARNTEFGGRLELIPSNSGTQPIVTAILFDAYDVTGGTTVTSSATALTIDTERINTHPGVFVMSSNQVQINQSGVYSFEYRASFDNNASATRTSARANIEKQPAGGAFASVPGCTSYTYNRITANGEDTANAKVILPVNLGDTFRISAQIIGGGPDVIQVASGTSLTIRKLA